MSNDKNIYMEPRGACMYFLFILLDPQDDGLPPEQAAINLARANAMLDLAEQRGFTGRARLVELIPESAHQSETACKELGKLLNELFSIAHPDELLTAGGLILKPANPSSLH